MVPNLVFVNLQNYYIMKKHLLFYLLVIVAMPVIGFSQNYYNVTYNIGFQDHPTAFASDLNGNIVVCGWYNEADETTTHAFALKVDANGQEVWRKTVQDASNPNFSQNT